MCVPFSCSHIRMQDNGDLTLIGVTFSNVTALEIIQTECKDMAPTTNLFDAQFVRKRRILHCMRNRTFVHPGTIAGSIGVFAIKTDLT